MTKYLQIFNKILFSRGWRNENRELHLPSTAGQNRTTCWKSQTLFTRKREKNPLENYFILLKFL
jgi:hypothetical protein